MLINVSELMCETGPILGAARVQLTRTNLLQGLWPRLRQSDVCNVFLGEPCTYDQKLMCA